MKLMSTRLVLATLLLLQIGSAQPSKLDSLNDFSRSIRALTQKVSPAVVQIVVSGYGTLEDSTGEQSSALIRQRSTGSGVVVDPEGYIITNAHVVRGAINVRVIVAAAKRSESGAPLDAKIIGIDRGTDLALIRVERAGLPTLPFGDSDALRQGDLVLAVGSPLGLQNSVSMGVVSSPARQIGEDNPLAYIQTDASINPGNSGGALVNVEGQLLGINSFIYTQSGGSQGIGFAVPSKVVQNVYQQLKKKGHVHRGEVGVFVQDITTVIAAGLKLPQDYGVLVADVLPGSPAAAAGLKPRDIITALDSKPIEFARDFELVFFSRQKGDQISVKVVRDGRELPESIVMEVSEPQDEDDALADSVKPETNLISRLGILCIEVDEKIGKLLPDLRQSEGIIVAAKSPAGQGRYINLEAGDVIHSMNDTPVGSLESFRDNVANFKAGDPVVLFIERSGTFRYIAFEID
jgi:serine protease Do